MNSSLMRVLCAVVLVALLAAAVAAQSRRPARPAGRTRPAVTTTQVAPTRISIDEVKPAEVARGEKVTLTGKFPTAEKIVVELRQAELAQTSGAAGDSAGKEAQVIKPEPVTVNTPPAAAGATAAPPPPPASISFVVPFNAPLGRYQVAVSFTQKGAEAQTITAPVSPDGMLHVVTKDPIKIEAVYPTVSYPVKGRFSLMVRGDGFSHIAEDNALVIEGLEREVLPACRGQEPGTDCARVTVSDNGRDLLFSDIPPRDRKGPLTLQVRVGDRYSVDKKDVTLARVPKKYPAAIAVISVLLLTALIIWILRRRRRAVTGGRFPGVPSAIFLDTDTNTYSLSKFQFYMWTGAALFGYIYLTVSKSWVQWDFTFADIPENLPGIIFISASTTVVSVGITSSKGSKGAGELRPSFADFFTSGGVVAAERLQFFVWTIIGVAAFIFLTLSVEPAAIRALPDVPERFLYLMGISSFGYLGGKLARKPGPIVTKIEAEAGSLTLTVHGTNLSPDAVFRIDDEDIPLRLMSDEAHPDGRPEVITTDEQPGFAKVLRIVINVTEEGRQKWLTGEHTFTIINPDGQKAAWTFTAAPAPTQPEGQKQGGATGQVQPGPEKTPADTPLDQLGATAATPTGATTTTPAGGPTGDVTSGAQTTGVPTITEVSPASGPASGNVPVIVMGTNFSPSAAVFFGESRAVTVNVLSPGSLVARTPPHAAGPVPLTVQNPDGGQATSAGGYTYEAASTSEAESVQGG